MWVSFEIWPKDLGPSLRRRQPSAQKEERVVLGQVLNLGCIVFSALMLWKGLMVVTKSESPVAKT